jgi:hypothetical protein
MSQNSGEYGDPASGVGFVAIPSLVVCGHKKGCLAPFLLTGTHPRPPTFVQHQDLTSGDKHHKHQNSSVRHSWHHRLSAPPNHIGHTLTSSETCRNVVLEEGTIPTSTFSRSQPPGSCKNCRQKKKVQPAEQHLAGFGCARPLDLGALV